MSHQQIPGGPGHPPASYPPYAQHHPAPYGYAPHQEFHAELDALPSIRSLTPYAPPVPRPQGVEMGMGVVTQPFYAGVVPMGAQYLQSDMMRYPVLPPDHRFRGPKKEIKRRTKTGCMTCRKRRIKCDETHPTCNNCRKSKRECLGYDPIFKQQGQQGRQSAASTSRGQGQGQRPPSSQGGSQTTPQLQQHQQQQQGGQQQQQGQHSTQHQAHQAPQQQQAGQHSTQNQAHQAPQQQEPHYLPYSNALQFQQQSHAGSSAENQFQQQPQTHAGSSAEHAHRGAAAPTTLPSITPSLVAPEYSDHPTSTTLDPSAFIPPSSGMQGYGHLRPGSDAGRQSLGASVDSFSGRQSLGADPSMTRQSLGIEARQSLGSVDSLGNRQSLGAGVAHLAGRQSLGGGVQPLARPLESGDVGVGVDGYGEARHASGVHAPGELEDARRGLGGVPT